MEELTKRLRKEFGLSERQAMSAIGAVLHVVRDHVGRERFHEVLRAVPEAEGLMKLSPEGDTGFFGVLDDVFSNVVGGAVDVGARLGGHFHSMGVGTWLAAPVAKVVVQDLGERVPGEAGRECASLLAELKL